MSSFLSRLSLSAIILFSVGIVLLGVLIPVTVLQIGSEYREIEHATEREAIAALDMLESVHVQAMLFRKQTADNDPAIDTLNGTMEQFSNQSRNVKLWLVMSPKVLNFQAANNQTEVEGPQDEVDVLALSLKRIQHRFVGTNTFRLTRPVIMGQGSAGNAKCAECHTALMGISDGEVIGAYSAEVDIRDAYAIWKRRSIAAVFANFCIVMLTLGLIYFLLRTTVLRPIGELANAADKIASGVDAVTFDGEKRPDALGALARSLNKFRGELTRRLSLELEASHAKDVAAAAKASDQAKSEFLANMSHEIRTPMNGVMGMAELLARTELDAKQAMFTDLIVKSGTALLTIINDILDFSKIEAGQLELDLEPFRLRDAVEQVTALVSSSAVEKNLELVVRVDPKLPSVFVGDVGRIRQVITNLIGNAVKFTEKGHVFVDVSDNASATSGAQNVLQLTFSIEDTGIGISADERNKIFEKFSQVDQSTTRKHEGTGLGLAISLSLVQLMGGKMGVESNESGGSTFWFTIDLPVQTAVHQTKPVPMDVSGAHVLIVDDNAVNRSILAEQVASWQFEHTVVSSGADALSRLRVATSLNSPIDVILLDYQMPQMNGAELVNTIRGEGAFAGIPIIMLTSVDLPEIGETISSLEIQGHLIKPIRSSLLLETVVDVLQRSRTSKTQNAENSAVKKVLAELQLGHGTPASSEHDSSNYIAAQPGMSLVARNKADWPMSAGSDFEDATQSDLISFDVLIVEDNEVNQIVMSQVLHQSNVRFQIVENGALAVQAYKSSRPKVILMDVSMPVMNGLDATKAIREIERDNGRHTPIIGVTAHALNGDKERCIEVGMDDYIPKPISTDMLTRKVQFWLRKQTKLELSA